jgi:hypothetical protein
MQYVVFNITTGEPIKWGQCQEELLDAQAGPGERALATSSLSVEGNRSSIWEMVKTTRTEKVNGGAATPWGIAQTDELARSNISGAALAALIAKSASAPFEITWTFADNSTADLNADQMIGLGLTIMQHVNACYDRARELRVEIDAATNMAELLAIDVASGWPT